MVWELVGGRGLVLWLVAGGLKCSVEVGLAAPPDCTGRGDVAAWLGLWVWRVWGRCVRMCLVWVGGDLAKLGRLCAAVWVAV